MEYSTRPGTGRRPGEDLRTLGYKNKGHSKVFAAITKTFRSLGHIRGRFGDEKDHALAAGSRFSYSTLEFAKGFENRDWN